MVKSLYIYIYIYIACAALEAKTFFFKKKVFKKKTSIKNELKVNSNSFFVLLFSFISVFVFNNYCFADDVTTNVNIQPSLTLSLSASSLALNLDPSVTTFGYKDLNVSVGTNNPTGYKLIMTTTSGTSDLVNAEDNTKVIETLPTLVGGYTESTFETNKWGYSNNNSNYLPFVPNTLLSSSDTATNDIVSNMKLAAKIDYLKESGTYATELQFTVTANPPVVDYIQDFAKAMCEEKASDADYTVVDKRDGNDYTVRYINGNCWLTQNLRYQGDTVSSTSTSTSWIMKSATSNINADKTMTMTDLAASNTYDAARYHVATADQVPSGASYTAKDMGVWYNYVAASAMTITGSSNANPQTYDICPKGWRLPTNTEQSGITSQASVYSPVAGGRYYSGALDYTGRGLWWSSTSNNSTARYNLLWDGSSLSTSSGNRGLGGYVRCVLR